MFSTPLCRGSEVNSLITASGRIRPTAVFTAAASSASAMAASAPISLNAVAESGDRVSANTSCWFACKRRFDSRPIALVAPAIKILIAFYTQHALPRKNASSAGSPRNISTRTSVSKWDRQFRLIRVHHEHREELRRFCFAGIGADDVAVAGQLGEALSSLVGRHRSIIDLTADRSLKHGRVDEG